MKTSLHPEVFSFEEGSERLPTGGHQRGNVLKKKKRGNVLSGPESGEGHGGRQTRKDVSVQREQ